MLNSKNFGVPKIRDVCSLSDILEEEVDERYFLSGDGAAITCEQPKINKVGNIRKKGKS